MRFVSSALAVLVLVTGTVALATESIEGPRELSSALREGDLIFHESTSLQAAAIREATGSRFTHVGLVFRRRGTWQVLEAVGPVRYTRLDRFVARGRGGDIAVRRLRDADSVFDESAIARLRASAETFVGRPYDRRFEMGDGAIYCSELVHKAYERGLGIGLGRLQTWDELALDGRATRSLVRRRLRGRSPSGVVITPAALLDAPEVVAVVP